jgi:hypothetical protein
MLRAVLIVVGALAVVVCWGVVVLLFALRTKSPRLLGAVRRFNRAFTNRLQRRSAGRPGAYASLLQHRGRTSGRLYETPVVAFPTDSGFLVSLPYGPNTDWLKNVLVSGSAVLVTDGHTHTVDHPEVTATDEARDEFPPKEQRTHRRFRVTQCLRLHIAETDDARPAAER